MPMLKLQGKDLYLATLEREDCRSLYREREFDSTSLVEDVQLGHSIEGADAWFEEMQRLQMNTHLRLGIFLNDGRVIGNVALQNLDAHNRSCSLGMEIARLDDRAKGYGKQAARLIIGYGFAHLSLERISANTLQHNTGAQKSLEGLGFALEGRARRAEYLNCRWMDTLMYGLLKDEWFARQENEK